MISISISLPPSPLAPHHPYVYHRRYHVQYTPKYIGSWMDASARIKPAATSFIIRGLMPADRYIVRVRAHNRNGWGPYARVPHDCYTYSADGRRVGPPPASRKHRGSVVLGVGCGPTPFLTLSPPRQCPPCRPSPPEPSLTLKSCTPRRRRGATKPCCGGPGPYRRCQTCP